LRHPPPAPVLGASAACGGRIGWTAVAGDAAASGGVGHGRQAMAESTYGGGRGVSSGGMGAEVTRREVDLLGGGISEREMGVGVRAAGRARREVDDVFGLLLFRLNYVFCTQVMVLDSWARSPNQRRM
jgi:hypothetical protein